MVENVCEAEMAGFEESVEAGFEESVEVVNVAEAMYEAVEEVH